MKIVSAIVINFYGSFLVLMILDNSMFNFVASLLYVSARKEWENFSMVMND